MIIILVTYMLKQIFFPYMIVLMHVSVSPTDGDKHHTSPGYKETQPCGAPVLSVNDLNDGDQSLTDWVQFVKKTKVFEFAEDDRIRGRAKVYN